MEPKIRSDTNRGKNILPFYYDIKQIFVNIYDKDNDTEINKKTINYLANALLIYRAAHNKTKNGFRSSFSSI